MKFKVGDEAKVKNSFDFDEEYRGKQFVIEECDSSDDTYLCHPTTGGYRIWFSEEKLEPADSKTLRMADGTIIGKFNAGGVVSIHDLPISEWHKLTFKNGSSIEALPQKDDTFRGENHFCTGFEAPYLDLSAFLNDGISANNGGKNSMKFTFYVKEGTRIDKSCNKTVPTMTTFVSIGRYHSGKATCDKVDYSERDGILNAIANAVLGGNFDREYEKFLADKKHKYDESCKCKICGRNYYEDEKTGKRTPFTPEDARKHEEWHEQNKKNKREKYLIRKEAKRRLAEAEREGKIEQTMKELYKK